MKPKNIVLTVVAALFAIVLLQNLDEIEITILFWKAVEMPKLALIISSILLGWIVGWFSHMAYRRKKQKESTDSGVQSPEISENQETATTPETPAQTEPEG